MQKKPFYLSRTLWSILATGAVVTAHALVTAGKLPVLLDQPLTLAQWALMGAGLWFARLGSGSPIAGPKDLSVGVVPDPPPFENVLSADETRASLAQLATAAPEVCSQ